MLTTNSKNETTPSKEGVVFFVLFFPVRLNGPTLSVSPKKKDISLDILFVYANMVVSLVNVTGKRWFLLEGYAMKKKYYRVRLNGASELKVNSLSQVKKLIRGSDDWHVSCFTGSVAEGNLICEGAAWSSYYDLLKKLKWNVSKHMNTDMLCYAIYKSRIAK